MAAFDVPAKQSNTDTRDFLADSARPAPSGFIMRPYLSPSRPSIWEVTGHFKRCFVRPRLPVQFSTSADIWKKLLPLQRCQQGHILVVAKYEYFFDESSCAPSSELCVCWDAYLSGQLSGVFPACWTKNAAPSRSRRSSDGRLVEDSHRCCETE